MAVPSPEGDVIKCPHFLSTSVLNTLTLKKGHFFLFHAAGTGQCVPECMVHVPPQTLPQQCTAPNNYCYTSFYRDSLHRMAMCGFCHLGWQIVGGMLMITRSMVTQLKGCLMYPALPVTCNILLTEVISHSLMHFLAMIWILLWVEALCMSGNRNMKWESRKRWFYPF